MTSTRSTRLLALCLALTFLLSSARPAAADGWQELTPAANPADRFDHAMAQAGGTVYLFGGLVGIPSTASNELWRYSTVAGNWVRLAPATPPTARFDHSMAGGPDGKLYVFGGSAGAFNPVAELWVYDPATNAWARRADGPQGRRSHGAAFLGDGRMIVVGGFGAGGARLNDVALYNPATNTWQAGAAFPGGNILNDPALAVNGQRVYLLTQSNTNLHIYDAGTNTWSAATPPTLPAARTGAAAVQAGTRAWLFGGVRSGDEEYLRETWELDLGTLTWMRRADMPMALDLFGAAILNPQGPFFQMLLYGGLAIIFPPSSRTWLYASDPPGQVTCIVTSTADAGLGTLRACLQNAGRNQRIVFDPAVFPATRPATIALTSGPLPDLAQSGVIVDGGGAGVIVDGSALAVGSGFRITSNAHLIRGLQIVGFPGHGVEVCCGSIGNTIGDPFVVGEGNIITGNGGDGVRVDGVGTESSVITANSIYNNAGRGIATTNGGNQELPPPRLVAAVGSMVSGVASAGAIVEIFGDDADEGRIYLGSVVADARGYFQFRGVLAGNRVTATATDIDDGNTSAFSNALPRSGGLLDTYEVNDQWNIAYPVTPGQWVSYISHPRDVDFYKLPVPARGSTVVFTLSGLSADFDLALFSPQDVPADTPLADIPLADIPLADIPLADIPLADIPLADIPLADIPLADIPLADIPLADIPLADISSRRGTTAEQVSARAIHATDFFYVRVTGYNGAYSVRPYTLKVEVTPPPALPTCSRSLPAATTGLAYRPQGDLKTLIIYNRQRTEQLYGAAATTTLVGKLQTFARHAAVTGLLVAVEQNDAVAAAYQAWDADACNPDAANEVTGAIKDLVRLYLGSTTTPTIRQLVIVGGDELIPFRRVADVVQTANEGEYLAAARLRAQSAHAASLAAGYLWADDFYVDFAASHVSDRMLYIPNYPIGRLVETPAEIGSQLDRFVAGGGGLNAQSALVVGYDFLMDGSQAIAADLGRAG